MCLCVACGAFCGRCAACDVLKAMGFNICMFERYSVDNTLIFGELIIHIRVFYHTFLASMKWSRTCNLVFVCVWYVELFVGAWVAMCWMQWVSKYISVNRAVSTIR